MMYAALALFLISAVLGLLIVRNWLAHKTAPRLFVYLHGFLAALALVLLIIWVSRHAENLPKIGLGLFVVAALIGFFMFYRDLRQKLSPWAAVIAHALLAVSGVVTLLLFLFT